MNVNMNVNTKLALTFCAKFLNLNDARSLACVLATYFGVNEEEFMQRYFLSSVPGIRPHDKICILRNLVPASLFYRMYHRNSFAQRIATCMFLTVAERKSILDGVLSGNPDGLETLDKHFHVVTGAIYDVPACDWSCLAPLKLGRYVVHPDLSVTLDGVLIAVRQGVLVKIVAHRTYRELLDVFRMVLPFIESHCDIVNTEHDFRGVAKTRGGRTSGVVRRKLRQRNLRLRRGSRRFFPRHGYDAIRHRRLPTL